MADWDLDPSYWNGMQLGARPPNKDVWENWTQEQKAAAGMPTFQDYQRYKRAWQARVQEGGDISNQWEAQNAAILARNPQNLSEFQAALRAAGINPVKEGGLSRWNQLMMAYQGLADPTGRYHYGAPGYAMDVATSDDSKRFTMLPYSGVQRGGLYNAIPGSEYAAKLRADVAAGRSSLEGWDAQRGMYYNTRPDGRVDYFDALGRPVSGGAAAANGGISGYGGTGGAGPTGFWNPGSGSGYTGSTGGTGGTNWGQLPTTLEGAFAEAIGETTKQARLDTLQKQFEYERAAKEYFQGVPIENYLTDFWGQMMGVEFDRPDATLSNYFGSGLAGVGDMQPLPGGSGGNNGGGGAPGQIGGNTPGAGNPLLDQGTPLNDTAEGGGSSGGGGGSLPDGNDDNLWGIPGYGDYGVQSFAAPGLGLQAAGAGDAPISLSTYPSGKPILEMTMSQYGGPLEDYENPGGLGSSPGTPDVPGGGGGGSDLGSSPGGPDEDWLGPTAPNFPLPPLEDGVPNPNAPQVPPPGTQWAPGAPVPGITWSTAAPGYRMISTGFDPANRQTWSMLAKLAGERALDLDAQKQQIMTGLPAGAERDRALAEATNRAYGDIGGMRQAFAGDALANLSGISQMKKFQVPLGNLTGGASNLLSSWNSKYNTDKNFQLGQDQIKASQKNTTTGGILDIFGRIGGAVAAKAFGLPG